MMVCLLDKCEERVGFLLSSGLDLKGLGLRIQCTKSGMISAAIAVGSATSTGNYVC